MKELEKKLRESDKITYEQFSQEAERDYKIVRLWTTIFWTVWFHKSSNPYNPFLMIDSKWRLLLNKNDKKNSWIDLKWVSMHKLRDKITKQADYKDLFYNLMGESLSLNQKEWDKSIIDSKRFPNITFNEKYNSSQEAILRSMYQVTWDQRNLFFSKTGSKIIKPGNISEEKIISILEFNEKWLETFTYIFSEIVKWLKYINLIKEQDIFYWWNLHHVQKKIGNNEILTEFDVIDICQFLMSKTTIEELLAKPEFIRQDQSQVKRFWNMVDSHKSLVRNLMYSLFFCMEKYEYEWAKETFEPILSEFKNNINEEINYDLHKSQETLWEKYHSKNEYCYTINRLKQPLSLWMKPLHKKSDYINDLIGQRAYINYTKYKSNHEKIKAISSIIKNILEKTKALWTLSWYEIKFTAIALINNYDFLSSQYENQTSPRDKVCNENNKFITNEVPLLDTIYNEPVIIIDKRKKKKNIKKKIVLLEKNQELIDADLIDSKTIKTLIKAMKKKKRWNLWSYQDIKIKIEYGAKKLWEDEGRKHNKTTWWIERQIVFSDHDNESIESSHFFFDRLKTSRCVSRWLSNIWFDQLWNMYQWMFDDIINKMTQRNRGEYGDHEERYVTHQFPKQNNVTLPYSKESLELHTLAKDPIKKIQAIKEFFCFHMDSLEKNGAMNRFFYENDLNLLWNKPPQNKKITAIMKHYEFDKILDWATTDRHKHRFIFDPESWLTWWFSIPKKSFISVRKNNKESILIRTKSLAKILSNQKQISVEDIKKGLIVEIKENLS